MKRQKRSQGGVKVPTGGNRRRPEARERLVLNHEGQQIRCDSEADGHSPDERERDIASFGRPSFLFGMWGVESVVSRNPGETGYGKDDQ
jgi:hypothetical protein